MQRNEKWHGCGAKHICKSKCTKHIKTPHSRSNFWSSNLEKWRAFVTRSKFAWQNAQNTTCSGNFLNFRLDVEKSRAAAARSTLVSQNAQNTTCSATFWTSDVEKSHAAVARSTFVNKTAQNTRRFGTLLDLPMWKRCPTEEIDRLILNQSVINQSINQLVN